MKRLAYSSLIAILFLLSLSPLAHAQEPPLIVFSDIISGPSTGLNDGLGEGAIVTIWGYRFGESLGKVYVTDNSGSRSPAAHIYYWKRADGTSPGGPADLYSSHELYEIAFSLPRASIGPVKISIETSSSVSSNSIPFQIISSRIFHVKPNGNNASGDGSFDSPWEYINGWDSRAKAPGNGTLESGDVVYTHGVEEPVLGDSTRSVGMYLRSINGTLDRQVSIISYPGKTSTISSPKWGIHPYRSSGIVLSKYIVLGGLLDDPMDDRPTFGAGPTSDSTAQIRTSKDGRVIGNYVSDRPGKCSNGSSGAISSTGDAGSNVKVLGNYIFDIGCNQTSHFQHTTYMSKRTADGQPNSDAWEFAWNRFEDNKAVFGIHFYDQSPYDNRNCDPVTGSFMIHHNFIRNQRGSGINIYTSDHDGIGACWEANSHIFNNILINTGLGPVAEINNGTQPYGISIGGNINGNFYIYHNLIYGVSDHLSREYQSPYALRIRNEISNTEVLIENNIIQTNFKMNMISKETSIDVLERNNIWFFGDDFENSLSSEEFSNISGDSIVMDPKISFKNEKPYISEDSPAIGKATSSNLKVNSDFFGKIVGAINNIGPLGSNSSVNPPAPPRNIDIN